MIDLPPSRLLKLLAAAEKVKAEDRYYMLRVVNAGMNGGKGYSDLVKEFAEICND